jgi:hypothetical protein
MNARGLNYGPAFRGVRGIASAGLRARGDIEDREPARHNTLSGPSGVGPERIDAALQLLISVVPGSCGEQTTFMPTGAASIVLRDLGRHSRGLVCDAVSRRWRRSTARSSKARRRSRRSRRDGAGARPATAACRGRSNLRRELFELK